MKYKAYYNKDRFHFIHGELKKTKLFSYQGDEKLRKTASFYGKKFNFYIDQSDGLNDDFKFLEYCGRILKIIEECKGKPFLYLKVAYSPEKSKNIIDLAKANNGNVIPFVFWGYHSNVYSYLLPNINDLRKKLEITKKKWDIGFTANLAKYKYPRPNKGNPLIAWTDYEIFGLGSPQNTGYYYVNSRTEMYKILKNSRFKFFHSDKLSYKEFIDVSLSWKACFCPRGIGSYSQRMFDHGYIGQCMLLRKNSYDFAISWKPYVPELDFSNNYWEKELEKIINNYEEWESKSNYYFNELLSRENIINLLLNNLNDFESSL